jgi:uncharacterized protein (TIGR00266 family)
MSNKNNSNKSNKNNKLSLLHMPDKMSNSKSGFPDYEINHMNSGISDVTIKLKKNQKIIADGGCMSFMSGNMGIETSVRNGFWSGIGRIVSGESFFLNTYFVESGETGKITFASFLPGDTKCIKLKKGQGIYLAPGGFICSTDNVKVSSHRRLRGVLFGAGLFLTEVICTEGEALVWVGCFGGVKEHYIKVGKQFKVDGGFFFCCDAGTDFEITTVGGIKSTLLSGEGIMMKFTGPAMVYTQSRGIGRFTEYIKRQIPVRRD